MNYISKAETQTGVMVALFPSPATAGMLAQPGGEPAQDLHVTLAFLGDATEIADIDRLRQVVQGFAATVAPLAGEISGSGQFTAGPVPVTYASVDLPGLPEARERLVEALSGAGFEPSTAHGFSPHVTLAYDDRDVQVPNLPLVFDAITLAVAGDRTSFPLTGVASDIESVTTDLTGCARCGGPGHSALTFQPLAHPVQQADGPDLTHWAACPANGEPILLAQTEGKVAKAGSVSDAPWQGDASRFTDAQWEKSCLLDRGVTAGTVKQRYALPVREPSGAINRRALASAAARLSTVKAHPEQVKAARAELHRLYVQSGLKVPASMNITKADTSWDVPIWKAQDTPERIVYGVVLHPGVTDSQGDVVSAAEIEQAAHRFLVESRKHDVQHAESVVPVETVESYIAPADLEVAGRPVLKGSWVMATRINDDTIWQSVMKDEITGYSIGGSAVRSES